MPRAKRPHAGQGVQESSTPAWVRALDTEEERLRVRAIELDEDRLRNRQAIDLVEERQSFLSRRSEAAQLCWPILAPQRVELLSLRTCSERDEFGEALFVEVSFQITLNDPAGTRLCIPVRVSAADAAAPGLFSEMHGPPRSPDYLFKAWYSLCRFARMLEAVANAAPGDEEELDTPLSRWLHPAIYEEELQALTES